MRLGGPLALSVIACGAVGCGASHVNGHSDAGHDARADAPDAARDGEAGGGGLGDSGGDGGAPVPTGTTLELGHAVALQGVTDDGYAIYTAGTLVKAVPVDGGAPVTIASGSAGSSVGALVSHQLVFAWTDVDAATNVGRLTLWSRSAPKPRVLSTASFFNVAAGTADSTAFVYSTDAASDGSVGSLVGGVAVDSGAPPATLATGVDVAGVNGCPTTVDAAGTGSSAVFVVTSCRPLPGDAGTVPETGPPDGPDTVVAYPVATWGAGPLATNVAEVQVDTTATLAAIAYAGGALALAPLGGGKPMFVEGPGTLNPTPSLYLASGDAFVLYTTSNGALRSSPTQVIQAMTLVPTQVNGIDAVSPDERWALVHNAAENTMMTGLPADMSLASITGPSTPTSLTPARTAAGALGDAFTADSSFAIFSTGVTIDAKGNAVATLNAVATEHPGALITLATAAVNAAGSFSPTDLALNGTRVLFTDRFDASVGATGAVDLLVTDLSLANATTLLVHGADPLYFTSPDRTRVLYTISYGGSTDGLYSAAAPQ